jgi:hypothetical protein
MQRTALLTPHSPACIAPLRWTAWLGRAWHRFTLDADERFIREACDLVDLELRLRRLERGRAGRFSPLDPDA